MDEKLRDVLWNVIDLVQTHEDCRPTDILDILDRNGYLLMEKFRSPKDDTLFKKELLSTLDI